MPPIMGAGAFLIAEYTRVPYIEIVKLSIFPAILYFMTVYLFVDIVAAKRGMRGMAAADLPRIRNVLRDGWHFLPPLAVLIYFLLLNISPARVGFIAIVSILAVAIARTVIQRLFVQRGRAPLETAEALLAEEPESITAAAGVTPVDTALIDTAPVDSGGAAAAHGSTAPPGWFGAVAWGARSLVAALEMGARNALPVSLACALAGIVVGVVGLTGLGLKFSSLMLSFAQGNILLALILVLLASLVLGMGLPVTASYIVLIVLTGPALSQEFGIPLVIAHLVVFWYSQDSNVTPPVALAAFAGAGIARADPMRTGIIAWKYAKGLYLIPMFMVFNPEIIMGGPFLLVAWNVIIALVALAAFAAALEGYMFTWMHPVSRLLAGAGLVCIFWPSFPVEVLGMVLMTVVLFVNYTRSKREQSAAAVPA
jgi:TRAP transporter 4TM/12TM fusion protein